MALLMAGAPVLAETGKPARAPQNAPAKAVAKSPARHNAKPGTANRAKAAAPGPAQADSNTVAALANSVWRVSCDLCDRQRFTPYFMILRDDMQVGSNLAAPVAWDFRSSPGTWRVHNGELFIEWRQGQDVQTYVVATLEQGWLAGLNHDNQQQVLTRVEQRRKAWEPKAVPDAGIDLDLPD